MEDFDPLGTAGARLDTAASQVQHSVLLALFVLGTARALGRRWAPAACDRAPALIGLMLKLLRQLWKNSISTCQIKAAGARRRPSVGRHMRENPSAAPRARQSDALQPKSAPPARENSVRDELCDASVVN